MNLRPARALVLSALALLALAAPAAADCAADAAPAVDWHRCTLDQRVMTDADLSGALLRDASFVRTDLSRANLSNAVGFRAKFFNTRLEDAILDGGDFTEADFTKADLARASLKGADLRRARFFQATLTGADLTGAQLAGADFTRADLVGALWTDGKHVCGDGPRGQCN